MSLDLARVIIDFGLVILILMVQLVVYPSFKHFERKNLLKWHRRYSFNLSLIVIPLMFAQLGLYSFQLIQSQTLFSMSGLVIVVLVWTSTFLQFVPLHQHISTNQHTERTLLLLVSRNWIRVILWSGLFVWSLVAYLG